MEVEIERRLISSGSRELSIGFHYCTNLEVVT